MKECTEHWAAMRQALHERGLTPFCPESAEDAHANVVEDLQAHAEGRPSEAMWDPLMTMCWNFRTRVLERMGLAALAQRQLPATDGMRDNDGHVCPLCVVAASFERHNTPDGTCGDPNCCIKIDPGSQPWDKEWIVGCADSLLEAAVAKGLVTKQ